MNPISWKKEVLRKATPFLKKFTGKVKRRFKSDLDDIHDTGDVHKYTETPGLLEKGLMFGLDLSNPLSGAIALSQQANPGEFIHDVSTSLPELPTVGGFQISQNPETDIGRKAGEFLQNKINQIGESYEGYQLARRIKNIKGSSIPVTGGTTRG
jgi:hypothetical protein